MDKTCWIRALKIKISEEAKVSYVFLLKYPVPLPVYAVFGALITGGIIYKLQPEASGEGYLLLKLFREKRWDIRIFFLHLDQSSPSFYAFIAAGLSGMLASSTLCV